MCNGYVAAFSSKSTAAAAMPKRQLLAIDPDIQIWLLYLKRFRIFLESLILSHF
jgi:hypothetical protein